MSYGRLIHHDVSARGQLKHAALHDLGAELLARLADDAGGASRMQFEQHLQLLTSLYEAIEARMDTPENRMSVSHVRDLFRFVARCHVRHGLPFADSVHVDVGCGSVNPLARLFTHVLLGVRGAIGIDLDEPGPAAAAGAARCLARIAGAAALEPARVFGDLPVRRQDVIARLDGFDVARLRAGDLGGVDAGRLALRHAPIEATGLATGSVDVVISHSVLEHVLDVDAALAELRRITRPGGFGVHGIDAIDHRWYGEPGLHPLEFLTIDASERMVCGCNRVRLVEFPELFRRHGFEVVDHGSSEPIAIPPELRARMVEPWRSMPDDQLDRTWANMLVRRL
jgi:SAM-dependent methyltransferase